MYTLSSLHLVLERPDSCMICYERDNLVSRCVAHSKNIADIAFDASRIVAKAIWARVWHWARSLCD